jgi:RNA polymerase sigma factor (sigma-70 family)
MENNTITDAELIIKVKQNNCNQSLKTLIQRHSALCFDICKKYSSAISKNGLRVEDVTEEKEFLIYKSAISFNPEKKTKFSTWLGNQVRYYCLNLMNKNNLIPTEDGQLDFFINKDVSYEPYSMEEKMDYINNIVDQIKDKRIQKIITLRYFNNPNKKTPWNKVAQEIGVSTQTAINLHNKAMGLLRTKMENKNIFAIDKI